MRHAPFAAAPMSSVAVAGPLRPRRFLVRNPAAGLPELAERRQRSALAAEERGSGRRPHGPPARCLWQVRSSLQRPRHRATGWVATTKTLQRLAGPEERVARADTMRPPARPPKDNDPRASSPGSA